MLREKLKPSRPVHFCSKMKINLNFYFHTSFGIGAGRVNIYYRPHNYNLWKEPPRDVLENIFAQVLNKYLCS